ncbi:MAG: hypothetical protein COA67_02740 [Lutibacter sp.]|nr:MAG: hypothetical protein COA67_02740 [Lutibacter sp.]
MKYIFQYKINFLLIIILIISCNNVSQSQDFIKNHDTKLSFQNDIKVKNVRQLEVWGKKYFDGETRLSSDKIKKIVKTLINKEYDDTVLSLILYTDFSNDSIENWTVDKNEIRNIGIYYINDNEIKLDYFEYPNLLINNYDNLSNVYCDAVLPFLFDKSSIPDNSLSVITLNLNFSEMPDLDSLNLSDKKRDEVFQLLKTTSEKYRN